MQSYRRSSLVCFFFTSFGAHPDLHSFPTRRSSDLDLAVHPARDGAHRPALQIRRPVDVGQDRKSTRLNSSHRCISYAVFCLKKKKKVNIVLELWLIGF